MSTITVYLTEAEKQELIHEAHAYNCNISGYFRKMLWAHWGETKRLRTPTLKDGNNQEVVDVPCELEDIL